MPNLTDVLNGEDESTIYENALEVCIANSGTTTLPTLTWLNFTVNDTEQGGYKWTTHTGDVWTSKVTHGAGYTLGSTGGGSATKLSIWEDALGLELGNTYLTWDGDKVLVSNPIAGASDVTNIMSLTQAQYNAIGTPDASTLYVING